MNEDAQLSIDLKTEKIAALYIEKRPYSAEPSITTGARSRVPVPRLGLLGMGAGEAHGATCHWAKSDANKDDRCRKMCLVVLERSIMKFPSTRTETWA